MYFYLCIENSEGIYMDESSPSLDSGERAAHNVHQHTLGRGVEGVLSQCTHLRQHWGHCCVAPVRCRHRSHHVHDRPGQLEQLPDLEAGTEVYALPFQCIQRSGQHVPQTANWRTKTAGTLGVLLWGDTTILRPSPWLPLLWEAGECICHLCHVTVLVGCMFQLIFTLLLKYMLLLILPNYPYARLRIFLATIFQ